MEAQIIGFERQVIQTEVENKETKKPEIKNMEIAIITLRSDVPDVLPVGRIVELTAKKEEKE